MIGTFVDAAAILLGTFVGIIFKRKLKPSYEDAVIKMLGLSVIFIGINGVITSIITVDLATGKLSEQGGLLLLISLTVGALLGEIMDLDGKLNGLGEKLERKLKLQGFAKAFISSTIIFCIGAMSVVGAINDGLKGDSSILFVKSGLDMVTAAIFSATLGIGVAFSCIPVLLYQGSISLMAGYIAPMISDTMLNGFCMVGYAIITCTGFNFLLDKKIKTANVLPALLIPILYDFFFRL